MDMDMVGHFEYLAEDTTLISQGIKRPISLMHKNRSLNSGTDYRNSYDDKMVEIVAKRFAEEIELFGYTFETKFPAKRCSGTLSCVRDTLKNIEDNV